MIMGEGCALAEICFAPPLSEFSRSPQTQVIQTSSRGSQFIVNEQKNRYDPLVFLTPFSYWPVITETFYILRKHLKFQTFSCYQDKLTLFHG